MRLEKLFSPIEIGGLTIKNRIVMAPMGANLENIDGSVSEILINYFEARARGGAGLIISPFTMVSKEHRAATLGVFTDRFIPGLNRLCNRVKSFGARFLLQIAHPGGKVMRELTGKTPVAPSSIHSPIYFEKPRELSTDEIEKLIKDFIQASIRAKEAEFDGVEVHGAHTYLIGQFISPHTNKRDDEYGGSFERRMKFPSQIVRGVKEACGENFIIGFKFSAHEQLEGGVNARLAQKIARHIEKQGVHYIHAASTSSIPGLLDVESDYPSDPSIYSPAGVLVKLAADIKTTVSIPVIATGGITDPEYAEKILEDGQADLVAIGRALIADPEWPVKAKSETQIKYCIKCNICHKRLWNKKSVKCTVNPAVGEEKRFEVKKAFSAKRVVIIGAGPAGMEAALMAAQRGHAVILYEENDQVGGKLLLGSIPPFKPEIKKLLEYYQKSIDKSNIEVKLGEKILSTKEIYEKNPEVIIVAIGAELAVPKMPGIKGDNVLSVLQLYEQEKHDIGKEVVIIGAGLVGCETSWYLALQGKSVTLIDILSRDELLSDEHPTNHLTLLRNMEKEGVTILDRTNAKKLVQEGVITQKAEGSEELLKADKVILATGFKPITKLKDAFIKDLPDTEMFWIGDCKEPGRLYNAIHEGFYTASQI